MPAPTITPVEPTLQLLTQHVAYSLQLAASESPTGWSATGLPAGLSISNAGLISGTPTAGDTVATAFVTATNGSGASAAVTIYFSIAAGVSGADDADDLARFVDWDLHTGYLTFAGADSGQPANHPPTLADSKPPIALVVGDRYPLSVGMLRDGTLRAVTGVEVLQVWLRDSTGDLRREIGVDNTDITLTGTGSAATTRREVMIHLDRAALAPWLVELADAGALAAAGNPVPPQTYDGALLQLTAEIPEDAREFSDTLTSAIASVGASQTKNHTFSVELDEEIEAAVNYTLVAELVSPSRSQYAASLTISLTAEWNGSTFTIVAGESLPKSVTKTPANPDNWNVVFSVQSFTGDGDGFNVAVRAVTGSETLDEPVTVIATLSAHGPGTTTTAINAVAIGPHWEFYDESDSLIGSVSFEVDPGTPDDAAALKTKIEAAISETVTSVSINSLAVSIEFDPDTAVAYVRDLTASPSAVDYNATGNEPLVLTDMSFRITVTGQAMAGTGKRLSSLAAPVRLMLPLRP